MKWEYRFVVLAVGPNGWQPRFINGIELADWASSPPVHMYSNELGAQGWEMITFTPISETTSSLAFSGGQKVSTHISIQMVFKRAL